MNLKQKYTEHYSDITLLRKIILQMTMLWFVLAYTMAKYGMSFCVLGMAEEFKEDGLAVNALWPRTGRWLFTTLTPVHVCHSLQ